MIAILPQTIKTAIVSPKAREVVNTIDAIIPGKVFLITTCLLVCHFVAPSAKAASLSSFETELKISTNKLVNNGKIIIHKTTAPANKEYPVE